MRAGLTARSRCSSSKGRGKVRALLLQQTIPHAPNVDDFGLNTGRCAQSVPTKSTNDLSGALQVKRYGSMSVMRRT